MELPVNGVGLRETCYFCGDYLMVRRYAVEIRGDMRLVCSHCFDLYNHGADDLLRIRTVDTFVCDGCGRTMPEWSYRQTSSGTYCFDCVSRAVEELFLLRGADAVEGGE